MHGLLHGRVEILDAKAQAIEPKLLESIQPLGIHGARVYFDRILAPRRQGEVALEHRHEFAQFIVVQKGRCATPQVQLRHGLPQADVLGVQIDLPAEVAQIRRGSVVVLGDDLVAGAVVAQRLTKRDVHVQGQRQAHACGARATQAQSLDVVVGTESFNKPVRSRVRGVPRA